jgi:hypothetical protein
MSDDIPKVALAYPDEVAEAPGVSVEVLQNSNLKLRGSASATRSSSP